MMKKAIHKLASVFGWRSASEGEKGTIACPDCGSKKWREGPRGGMCQNMECSNGHRWNFTPFGLERI
jgi:hypothetical protein